MMMIKRNIQMLCFISELNNSFKITNNKNKTSVHQRQNIHKNIKIAKSIS